MSQKISKNKPYAVYKPQSPFERLRLHCECKYEALYRSIILQAIIDASGAGFSSNKKNIKIYNEAKKWLFESDECNVGKFRDVCEKAGLNHSFVQKTAKSLIDSHAIKLNSR